MSKRFLARLKATAKYAKDCWAKSLGPTMVSVAAVNLAYLTGALGVWWPTVLAAALCGIQKKCTVRRAAA